MTVAQEPRVSPLPPDSLKMAADTLKPAADTLKPSSDSLHHNRDSRDSLILDPLIKSQPLLYLSLKQSMDSSRPGPGIRKPQSHSDSLKIASGTSDTLKPRPDSGKALPCASGPPGHTPPKTCP